MESGRRRSELERWFVGVVQTLPVLDLDRAVAATWARLAIRVGRAGKHLPAIDGFIAATALYYDLIIATRDTHDFAVTGVRLVNPFSGAAGK